MKHCILFLIICMVIAITAVSCNRSPVIYTLDGKPVPKGSSALFGKHGQLTRVFAELDTLEAQGDRIMDSLYYYRDTMYNAKKLRYFLEESQKNVDKTDSIWNKYELEALMKVFRESEKQKSKIQST